MVFSVAPLVSTGAAFVCSYSHVFGSQTICSDEQIFRVNRLDWITPWNNPFISQSVQLSSPSIESHPAGICSPSPGPSLRGERCMSNDSITDHDTVESEPRVIDSRWVTQARLSPSPALRHVLEVQSRKHHTLSFDNCREAYSTCWSKLAAFSLLKVFAFRKLLLTLTWTEPFDLELSSGEWDYAAGPDVANEPGIRQRTGYYTAECLYIANGFWNDMKTFCCDDCALCCNRDKAGVWAMTAGLMMYSVAGLYSRRSFWPFISLSPLPVTVITSRNESCASWQSALLWKLIGRHFFFTSLDIFSFSFTFLLLSFSSPSLPVSCFPLIVFKSLFISPFLFQFYLFNWFVCFTRQEMHSSHSLGRLHITHFGNVKSRSPHIWSASLCVSAVQVRWFKHWLTAMMDLLFLLLISAAHIMFWQNMNLDLK